MELNAIKESFPEHTFLIMDGLDNAVIGYQYKDDDIVIVYDENKIIEELMKQEMTEEEAWDWYHFNIACAYIDELQPIIIIT